MRFPVLMRFPVSSWGPSCPRAIEPIHALVLPPEQDRSWATLPLSHGPHCPWVTDEFPVLSCRTAHRPHWLWDMGYNVHESLMSFPGLSHRWSVRCLLIFGTTALYVSRTNLYVGFRHFYNLCKYENRVVWYLLHSLNIIIDYHSSSMRALFSDLNFKVIKKSSKLKFIDWWA